MAYESLQAILEEAGLSHVQLSEVPHGVVDGTNKVFTISQKPLTDRNYDDVVDVTDVFVLVNGSPATVSAIDATNGVITLQAAPAANAEVLIDYRYSPIALTTVDQRRTEAQDFINSQMVTVDPCAPYTGVFNPTGGQTLIDNNIRQMVRIYAAAMLLIRDFGFNQDTELTSKDGYKKMELVTGAWNHGKFEPGMLDGFMKIGGVCGGDAADATTGGLGGVLTDSSGDLFGVFDASTPPRSEFDEDSCEDW